MFWGLQERAWQSWWRPRERRRPLVQSPWTKTQKRNYAPWRGQRHSRRTQHTSEHLRGSERHIAKTIWLDNTTRHCSARVRQRPHTQLLQGTKRYWLENWEDQKVTDRCYHHLWLSKSSPKLSLLWSTGFLLMYQAQSLAGPQTEKCKYLRSCRIAKAGRADACASGRDNKTGSDYYGLHHCDNYFREEYPPLLDQKPDSTTSYRCHFSHLSLR